MIQLRDYQAEIATRTAALLVRHRIALLAMECRTGKTLTALAAAAQYGAKRVLFLTKKKAIASVQKDYELLGKPFEMTLTNYESAHKVPYKLGCFDLAILDESHSLGTYPKPSSRARTAKLLCRRLPIIYLSATPTPESYSQLFHQFWCSSYTPWAKYSTFYKWAKDYVDIKERMINGIPSRDYSAANKMMVERDTSQMIVSFTQQQAGFDTEIVEATLTIKMSDWTAEAIKRLKRDKILRWNDVTILGDTPAKLMNKVHQLSSGSVIDEEGNHIITDYNKAAYIRDRFLGKKIALFYVYQSEADLLRKMFPRWTDNPELFQSRNDLTFIAQVRSAREGVRLDTADALIYYNLEYSFLSYEQGRNRLASKERTTPCRVFFVVSDCGIESDILKAVHSKEDYTYSWFNNKR